MLILSAIMYHFYVNQDYIIDSDDMSFVHLIAKVRDMDPTSSEFISTFNNYYLTDQKTGTLRM